MCKVFKLGRLISKRPGQRLSVLLIAGIVSLAVVCGGSGTDTEPQVTIGEEPTTSSTPVSAAPVPTVEPSTGASTTPTPSQVDPTPTPTESPSSDKLSGAADVITSAPEQEATSTPRPELDFDTDEERSRAERLRTIWGWGTNLNQRNISLFEVEIVLPRDRITPIDEPTFAPVAEAPAYMNPREPVVAVIVDGDARAYPLAILMWHEIVNDTVGGLPVTVTFCPLCNTGITFDRTVDGQELTFGTSGMLRNSDLVMWDRQTQSWWQQITGEALVGDFAAKNARLKFVPSSIIAWETFAKSYPQGQVLERLLSDLGQPARPYDDPPYAGYDNVDDQPFLFKGSIDGRLVATSRVLTIDGDSPVAYPFSFLEESPIVNDTVDGTDLVAFFDNGTLSAFNDLFSNSQTSGSVAVFSRTVGSRTLTFELTGSGITDTETGSTWNLAGIATGGELEGTQLSPVVHANHFWFAWAVFKPNTEIRDSLADLKS